MNRIKKFNEEKNLKKQDVIEFIDWEIGNRKTNTPILKNDQNFINVINNVINDYKKRYQWI